MSSLGIIPFVFVALATFPVNPLPRALANQTEPSLIQTLSTPRVRDFDWLIRLIEHQNLRTIEDVIPALPPEFLNHYTLIRQSTSLQLSSATHPRAILYGEDARLIITFNGNPLHKQYYKLEVAEFHDTTASFSFHQIHFYPGGKQRPWAERNPAVCLNCHRQDARPNWSSSGVWPRAYGSINDRLFGSAPLTEKMGIEIDQKELELFQRYLEVKPNHDRYKHLGPMRVQDDGKLLVGKHNPTPPNEKLTKLITSLNDRRIVRIMGSIEEFHTLRYLVLLELLRCDTSLYFQDPTSRAFLDDLRNHFRDKVAPALLEKWNRLTLRAYTLDQAKPSFDRETLLNEVFQSYSDYRALTLVSFLATHTIYPTPRFRDWHTNFYYDDYSMGPSVLGIATLALPFSEHFLTHTEDFFLKNNFFGLWAHLPDEKKSLEQMVKSSEENSPEKLSLCSRLREKNAEPFKSYLEKLMK